MQDIDSAAVSQLRDSSSEELLREIERKKKVWRWAPWVGGAGFLFLLWLVLAGAPDFALIVYCPLLALATWGAHQRDELEKSVVLFYELDSEMEAMFSRFCDAFDRLKSCRRVWHVEAQGDVEDWKRNAGAARLLRRSGITLRLSTPSFLKTNLSVPVIPVGRQKLFFFPDRILIFDFAGVGAVGYGDLRLERRATPFIEDGAVPSDAQVVDHTWKFVNKRGGPDRRFRDNREIPIALYEQLHFSSRSGLNELVQVSSQGAGQGFERELRRLAEKIPA
ncbi:MAG: hypothetical protein AAF604_09320 [Acidobacteriota bacterium]